ncbi:TetR/AcrR family transcriptional regulator [Kineococcus arenarius]|uniref:TetR/AcrR family transcriptional regulator n=1 Tax=unclassified Kineococcus TaxID=2621656 RepID=UPI003D7E9584
MGDERSTTTAHEERHAGAGRARLHEAALRLFAEHGVSGTSLQMIADALGVTKAAVYWHYRTKDEIVLGVLTPVVEDLTGVVETARARRGPRARTEALITGLVDVVVRRRMVYVVLAGDPFISELLGKDERLRAVVEEMTDLVAGPGRDEAQRVSALMFLAGLVGPLNHPACAAIADDDLRRHLVEGGRRLLLTRAVAKSWESRSR